MKKSKVSQATLFQSWGRPAQSSSSRNPNSNRIESNTSRAHNGEYSGFDPNEIVEMEDDDDDDELLAAAEGIVPFDEAKFRAKYNGGEHANATDITRNADEFIEIEVIPGFDLEAGNVWIYPTNYPIRNYQYDIVEQALYKNTLVTLPTGLGKTFIAAVIMYNFYRWYPQGKVIFMAPTKPLVAQQIEACYNIMGIPQSDTAEMTGNMAPSKRQSLWQSRRVFFLTPQVLQNDLNRGSCKAEEVVLLVADEAHKALGNHAYCQVVREISGYTRNFRVLALSATPGDNAEAVQQVITNLLISHMELRSEDSPDIQPYTHSRLVEKVVVSLGENITKVKNSYLKILETIVGRLFCQRVLWNKDPQRVTKFMLLTARDQYRKRMNEQGGLDRTRQGLIEGDFAMCISLYHAYELLLQHGILSFYNFIKAIMDGTKGMARAKAEITKNHEFTQLMDELREEIEPPMDNSANESLLFSQFSPKQRALMNAPKPSSTFKSHPKLLKLKEIVLEHFEKFQDKNGDEKKGVATRVMIFSQYRDSVNEIAAMLSRHKPLVRVMSFIGQQSTGKSTRGLSQKEQLQVVQRFRQGGYNTLVATCVGEEGLDIGEVDLIVCFDAHASPIRLVQRMGRTGRKRDGRIVILVTEGKEEQVYMRSQRSKKSIHKAVMQAAKSFDLYMDNHRMVPRQIAPTVLKMEMTVGKFVGQSKGKKKERPSDGANIKKFTTKSATATSKKSNGFLTYEELVYWQEHFKLPEHEAGLSPQLSITKKSRRSLSEAKKPVTQPSLTEWLPWQTTLNPVKAVTHSRRTEHLVELLEFTELHGGRGDDDESYDLEMMSFLNEEDILKPGQKEGDAEDGLVPENDDVACEESVGASKITKKGKKTRKKLQMEDEADAENSEKSSRQEGNGEGGTATKKKGKGLKKRSPENKARWKEFLKQFDNKEDEDFESDGVNVAAASDADNAVDDCLQRPDDETLEDDLPDVAEPWEPDDKPADLDNNQASLNGNNEPVKTHKETARIQESEGGELSDAASDELSNLFPTVTPHSQSSVPVFQLQKARFPLTMASVPTPPSVDALDKISLSSAGEELDDFEGIQRKYFGKNLFEKDVVDNSPKVCFESDSLTEPFLMADFLEEEELKTVIHTSEGETVRQISREEKGLVTSTPETPSETATKADIDEPVHEETRFPDSEKPNSKDNVDHFESNVRGEQDARDVVKTCNTREDTKDRDARGITNDVVVDTECSSPTKEEDATFGEAFFMDVTDDDAFTNITLPEDDFGVNDTRSDQSKHAGGQGLLLESECMRNESREARDSEVNMSKTRLERSKHLGKNVTGVGQFGSSVGVDLRTSISKLSAFQRCSTNDQDSHTRKEKIGVSTEIKHSLSKESSTMETRTNLPSHEVRTRGELSSSTAYHSEVAMLDAGRNSAAVPPVAMKTMHSKLSNKLGTKENHHTGAFRDGLPGRDGAGERPVRESHLTKLSNRATVANGNGDVGNNISGDIGGNTGSNIGDNTSSFVANNVRDTACRSPLPKKLKLSRKRTSPKDKGMPTMKTQGSNLPINEAESLDFGSSKSLSVNQPREENFCGTNLKESNANSSSRGMEYKGSEMALKQSLPMGTVPKGPSLDCAEPLANPSNLRTENGNVVAVMESDDEDEDAIRPVGKASSRRRQALSSPCSQGFKKPANPERVNQRLGLSSRHLQLGSESDEEFETDKSAAARSRSESAKTAQAKPRAQKRNSLEISAKQGTKQSLDSLRKRNNKRLRKNHFLDEEAELSGSDINDFSSDETEDGDEDEMDSFIDDATQLTQRTPSATKPRHASSPVDMMAVYRQSLMSPLCGALNFQTPVFHKQRNKYKMVYKNRTVDEDSQSASEAEETYESESILENEVEAEDENEAEIEYESEAGRRKSVNAQTNAQARTDVSFEESQIGRPVKRMKRKRILDDSFDGEVSPKLSKQRNMSETCDKENVIENNALDVPKCNNAQMPATQLRRSNAFGNFSVKPTAVGETFHGDFVKSSQALTNKKTFHDNTSALRRSAVSKESMRRSGSFHDEWNDISDSELLVALDDKAEQRSIYTTSVTKPPPSDQFHDQDLKEVAVAMDMTDHDVSMEINTFPNFSLGFDFLWEVISAERESAQGRTSSKENSVTFPERNKNCTESIRGNNSTDFPNYTKITQHSKQTTERSFQRLSDQETKNKGSVGQLSCPAYKPTTIAPSKVTNSNVSNGSSVISGQRLASNNSLTAQNTSSLNSNGQRSTAHPKLQVVTPSCRPNNLGTRPAISPLLTSSQKDKGKTVILVDTREISSSQVVSLLRLKHNIKAEVCQLTSCDYIVSNRMAVKRKTASDVANGNNSEKLVECMRRMCNLYDRPCLIIEKDRVKPGETEKHFIKTKAYIFTLASIAQTHVKMVFSDSQEETARLLTDLAAIETIKGTAITAPTALSKEREQVFRVLLSIPRVSYITALNLCSSYNTLQEIISSTPAELERRTPGLSSPRAAEIHKYLRHKFNSDMLAAKK